MSFSPPTVTGYAGGFDPSFARSGNGAEANYNAVTRYARDSAERKLSLVLSRGGNRALRAAMRILNGTAAGSSAAASHQRVRATPGVDQGIGVSPGGLRTTELFDDATGNSTAGMVTYINDLVHDAMIDAPVTVTDLSGNGGGGKVQF